MEFMIDMPMINHCDVAECSYNLDAACHAKAVTIGDGVTPGCDTFMRREKHVSNRQISAGVGACKISGCSHNTDFECGAESIEVSHGGSRVLCMTYTQS